MARLPRGAPALAKALRAAAKEQARTDAQGRRDDEKQLCDQLWVQRLELLNSDDFRQLSADDQRLARRFLKSFERWEREDLRDRAVDVRSTPPPGFIFAAVDDDAGPRQRSPRGPGRPRQSRPSKLNAARAFRGKLTRTLQAAKRESLSAFAKAIRAALETHTRTLTKDQKDSLLRKVVRAGGRPSDGASRIAAACYDVPLDQVRRGKNLAPRSRAKRQPVDQLTSRDLARLAAPGETPDQRLK